MPIPPLDYKAFGRQIRAKRKSNRMSQKELAELGGISLSFLGHIERGDRKASIETLVRLAIALGATPNDILRDSLAEAPIQDFREKLSIDRLIDAYLHRSAGTHLGAYEFFGDLEQPLASMVMSAFFYGVKCGQEGMRIESLLE